MKTAEFKEFKSAHRFSLTDSRHGRRADRVSYCICCVTLDPALLRKTSVGARGDKKRVTLNAADETIDLVGNNATCAPCDARTSPEGILRLAGVTSEIRV